MSTKKTRDLRAEYLAYHSSPEQKKRRAARNTARATMEKQGKVSKGDNKDVDHANGNPLDNRNSNLKVKAKSANRSYPRTATARKKNARD